MKQREARNLKRRETTQLQKVSREDKKLGNAYFKRSTTKFLSKERDAADNLVDVSFKRRRNAIMTANKLYEKRTGTSYYTQFPSDNPNSTRMHIYFQKVSGRTKH